MNNSRPHVCRPRCHLRRLQRVGLIAGLLAGAFGEAANSQTVYYVDADATGPVHDGSTWCTAFETLEPALAISGFRDEVRVADGEYTPDTTGFANPREASFTLPFGAAIRGGYAGCGADDEDRRQVFVYETVLSGDLHGNDASTNDRSENCYHVVTARNLGFETILDGFVISAGNADGPEFPTGNGAGGGLFSIGSLTVENCRFLENRANFGGGMHSLEGSPVLTSCRFERNRAVRGGGLLLFGFNFRSKSQGYPAPAEAERHGTPQLTDCDFVDNHASEFAGALWISGVAENPTLRRCRFHGNRSLTHGAALYSAGGFCKLLNCLFDGNMAGEDGGAIYNETITILRNCTVVENSAARGGGIYSPFFHPTIDDTILWHNTAATATGEEAQVGGPSPIVNRSCIQGWSGAWGGEGNIGANPRFVSGPAGGLQIGDFYLSQRASGQAIDSPCIDAASAEPIEINLDGVTTRTDEGGDAGAVDMGFHYTVTGLVPTLELPIPVMDLTLVDFANLQRCFSGPQVQQAGIASSAIEGHCRRFDYDLDQDVDDMDYISFHQFFDAQ